MTIATHHKALAVWLHAVACCAALISVWPCVALSSKRGRRSLFVAAKRQNCCCDENHSSVILAGPGERNLAADGAVFRVEQFKFPMPLGLRDSPSSIQYSNTCQSAFEQLLHYQCSGRECLEQKISQNAVWTHPEAAEAPSQARRTCTSPW